MKMIKDKKLLISLGLIILILFIGASYAYINFTLTGTKTYSIVGGELKLTLDETNNSLTIGETEAVPVSDYQGLQQDGYNFSLINEGKADINYYIYLEDNNGKTMDDIAIKYGYILDTDTEPTIGKLSDLKNRLLVTDIIHRNEKLNYNLKFWINQDATNEQVIGKTFSVKLKVVAEQITGLAYQDKSGASIPNIKGDLLPVRIDNTGKVKKANLEEKWYDYNNSEWANAVIVNNETKVKYKNAKAGTEIPDSDIESYFVWIPRYKYKLFNVNHDKLEPKEIEISFESKDIPSSNGSTNGTWLTHPAFTNLNVDGIWVGKFETGYKGATRVSEAEVNTSDTANLIIKPNVYSWRNISLANSYNASFNYKRDLDSHMMKNTEWGAITYLYYSKYGRCKNGICEDITINNNSEYITGIAGNTINEAESNLNDNKFYTEKGQLASTTGNPTGVYDMSGGAWDVVIGYTKTNQTGGETGLSFEFLTNPNNSKYIDIYNSSTNVDYKDMILGDATGETLKLYNGFQAFAETNKPVFERGGHWLDKEKTTPFGFFNTTGAASAYNSFRVVLSPTK